MTPARSCRTCVYWDKPLGKRAMAAHAYACVAPLPAVALPDCLAMTWLRIKDPINRRYMERDDGKSCPAWSSQIPEAPK